MFPVQLPGEGAGCSGEWGEARDEAWHLMSISFKFWKLLAKKFLFVANDWHVNQQENQQDHDGNPPALRSPAEACAQTTMLVPMTMEDGVGFAIQK